MLSLVLYYSYNTVHTFSILHGIKAKALILCNFSPSRRYSAASAVSGTTQPPPSEIRLPACQEADSSPNGLAATLGSRATGLRSRHIRCRWKDLGKLDSTTQKTAQSAVGRALTRRLKIRPPSSCLPRAHTAVSLATSALVPRQP
jgi:hypothetical protein